MLIHKLTDKEKELLAAAGAAYDAAKAEVDRAQQEFNEKTRACSAAGDAQRKQIADIRELYFDAQAGYHENVSDDGEHLVYQKVPVSWWPSNPYQDVLLLNALGGYRGDAQAIANSRAAQGSMPWI